MKNNNKDKCLQNINNQIIKLNKKFGIIILTTNAKQKETKF